MKTYLQIAIFSLEFQRNLLTELQFSCLSFDENYLQIAICSLEFQRKFSITCNYFS
nr:F-box domain-containing protein [Pithovirus mammoth]